MFFTPFFLQTRYNQNFRGLYCTCSRPYPDPEDPVPDQMIQCILCEDWFHGRHLMLNERKVVPSDTAYAEMVCQGCVQRNPFLMAYQGQAVRVVEREEKDANGKGKKSSNGSAEVGKEEEDVEVEEDKKGDYYLESAFLTFCTIPHKTCGCVFDSILGESQKN